MRVTDFTLMLSICWLAVGAADAAPQDAPRAAAGGHIDPHELPEGFAWLKLSDGFELIESSESPTRTTLRLLSWLDFADAKSAVNQALREAGWHVVHRVGEEQYGRGFVHSAMRGNKRVSLRLCDSNNQNVHVLVAEEDQGVGVRMSLDGGEFRAICRRQRPGDRPRGGTDITYKLMPALELPPRTTGVRASMVGRVEAAGDFAQAWVRMKSDQSRDQLLAHFSEQLRIQAWAPGISWSSGSLYWSSWTLAPDGLPATVGTFYLVELGDSEYSVRFAITAIE